MGNIIQQLISALIQILLFALLPFIWWWATARRKSSFFEWLGLKPIKESAGQKLWLWSLLGLIIFLLSSVFMLLITRNLETATAGFSGLGFSALPGILIYSLLQTSLPEELLFRGFLLKRLSSRLPFAAANFLQAACFGLLHGLMFVTVTSWVHTMFIVLLTGSIAACMGFVNEKKAGGSILCSWASSLKSS